MIKVFIIIITSLFFNINLWGQEGKINKTRFVIGLSGPELLHAGITHRIANASQLGKDILFKNIRNGITIDAGVFYLPESERSSIILVRSLSLWPALRFEFFFSL